MSKISRQKKKIKQAQLEKLGLLPKDFCETCGNEFLKSNLYYGPCPFNKEVYNNHVEVVLCLDCYKEGQNDV